MENINMDLCATIAACNQAPTIDQRNICRILVNSRVYDWEQPPNRSKFTSGTGTGFVLNHPLFASETCIYILTAHHVVQDYIQIRVHFDEVLEQPIEATLIGSNPLMDVALLQVTDIPELRIQNKDKQNKQTKQKPSPCGLVFDMSEDAEKRVCSLSKVTALGFALGKPHLQTTAGVISGRITDPSRLQVDVAVNPGNSGGPLLDERATVVGIVTSGMSNAQNINYVAPIHETMRCMERILAAASVARPLFKNGDRLTIADGRVISAHSDNRSVALSSGEGGRVQVVLEGVDAKVNREISVQGYRFHNVPKQALFDQSSSLNINTTKANRVLLDVVSEDCKSGVLITAVNPRIEEGAMEAGDYYSVTETHCIIFKSGGQLMCPLLNYENYRGNGTVVSLEASGRAPAVDATVIRFGDRYMINKTEDMLLVGDVLCSIDGIRIDEQMRVEIPFWYNKSSQKDGKLPYSCLLDRKNPGEVCHLQVWRRTGNESRLLSIDMVLRYTFNKYKQKFPDLERTDYVCRGGVFVMEAAANHSKLFGSTFLALLQSPERPFESCIILTSILPENPFNENTTIAPGDIVIAVNNWSIHSLKDYRRAWRRETLIAEYVDKKVRCDFSSAPVVEEVEDAIVLESAGGDLYTSTLKSGELRRRLLRCDTVFKYQGVCYQNLKPGIVHLRMRDGSVASAKTGVIEECDKVIRNTYSDLYVTY